MRAYLGILHFTLAFCGHGWVLFSIYRQEFVDSVSRKYKMVLAISDFVYSRYFLYVYCGTCP